MSERLPWIRLWRELVDDPKVRARPREVLAAWVTLCLLASDEDGSVRAPAGLALADYLAAYLGRPSDADPRAVVSELVAQLVGMRLVVQRGPEVLWLPKFLARQGRTTPVGSVVEPAPVTPRPENTPRRPPSADPAVVRLRKLRSEFNRRVRRCAAVPAELTWDAWIATPEGAAILAGNEVGNDPRTTPGTTRERPENDPGNEVGTRSGTTPLQERAVSEKVSFQGDKREEKSSAARGPERERPENDPGNEVGTRSGTTRERPRERGGNEVVDLLSELERAAGDGLALGHDEAVREELGAALAVWLGGAEDPGALLAAAGALLRDPRALFPRWEQVQKRGYVLGRQLLAAGALDELLEGARRALEGERRRRPVEPTPSSSGAPPLSREQVQALARAEVARLRPGRSRPAAQTAKPQEREES